MSLRRPLKTQNLVPSAARTTSGNSGAIVINDMDMKNVLVRLSVSAASGTSPTLDVYFQQSLDGGQTFVDVAHFLQVTAALTNPHYLNLAVGANNSISSGVGDGTIAANSLGTSLVSNVWRIKWVIGGTSPSFTFAVDAFYA
ncbi:MAG: hypothetical protein KatS3mg096_748 [Candidatus Parcubacteria bacterium]|nr:MAG: hypothetical protein KatS3mg096_748 [Candidatus Parcubacteria bacterium]